MDTVTEARNFAPLSKRCAAKSKRSQKPCRNPAVHGVDKCRMHGGTVQGRPAEQRITHGQTSQFVRVDDLPEIVARMRELDTPGGRVEAIKRNFAVIEKRREKIPDAVDFTDVAIKAAKSLR